MKQLRLLLVCFATLAVASCSLFNSATSSDPVAMAAGQSCGVAVQGLYSSYQNTGTINLANPNDLNNTLVLAGAYTTLKQNKDNKSYKNAFASGLVASSAGLITTATANKFIDKLLATSSLGNVNAQNITETAATAAAVITLINTLKQ